MRTTKTEKTPRNPIRFVTSATNLRQCPDDDRPEVALAGRSNSGKSSLINGLARSKIAKISSAPGKTRLLNFYDAGSYRFVDMPGYGFSKRSGDEQMGWHKMIEPYLSSRGNLVGLLLLMDVRREWSQSERDLLTWMRPLEIPVAIVLTKADKVSKNELQKAVRNIRKASCLEAVLLTSALAKTGFMELEDFVFRSWVGPRLGEKRPE